MAQGDRFRLAVESILLGQQVVNVFHYEQVVPVLNLTMTDLAENWETNVLPLYLGLSVTGFAVNTIRIRDFNTPQAGIDYPTSGNGTQGGEAVPIQSAPIITWRTDFIGRSRRGRSYLPPPSEGNQNGGGIVAAQRTAMTDFADAAIMLLDGTGLVDYWQMVIYSRTLDSFTPVTDYTVRESIGTIRGRRLDS